MEVEPAKQGRYSYLPKARTGGGVQNFLQGECKACQHDPGATGSRRRRTIQALFPDGGSCNETWRDRINEGIA